MTTILQQETTGTLTQDGLAFQYCRDPRKTIYEHPNYLSMVQAAWTFEARLDGLLAETDGDGWPGLNKLRQLDRSVIRNNIKALTQAALERYGAEMQRPIREILPEAQRHAQRLLSMLNERDRFLAQAHTATGLQAKPIVTKKLIDTLTALVAQIV